MFRNLVPNLSNIKFLSIYIQEMSSYDQRTKLIDPFFRGEQLFSGNNIKTFPEANT